MPYPTNKLFLLDQRLPGLWIPIKFITFLVFNTGDPTHKEHSFLISIHYLDKTQHKNISIAANNTLDGNIAKLALLMGRDLIVLGFDKMENNMRGQAIFPTVVTKPFPTAFIPTLYHTIDIRYATKRAGVSRPLLGD